MTPDIKRIVENAGYLICPSCNGEGEVGYFCGHETTTSCNDCAGKGVVRSLNQQTHRKPCDICSGRGGRGCCDFKGYHEWTSHEII